MRRSAEVIGRRIPAGRHTSCRVLCLSGVAENRGRCKNTRKESADALSFFAIFFGGFPSCGRTGIVWQRASEPLLVGREEEHAGGIWAEKNKSVRQHNPGHTGGGSERTSSKEEQGCASAFTVYQTKSFCGGKGNAPIGARRIDY